MKPTTRNSIRIRKSCTRRMRVLDALSYIFNRRTGRPTRYEWIDDKAPIGFTHRQVNVKQNGSS